jgi:hypothetical protein
MKKFLLLALAAAMLSNPAACMDNDELPMECGMLEDGTIIVPDRMEVVRGGRDYCAGAGAAVAAGLLAHSLYEGNVFLGGAAAGALAGFTYEFMKKEVHIKLYDGQKNLGTILEAEDIQTLIGKLQKQIDDWNKLRSENPAAAQELKNKIRRSFQQFREQNAKKEAVDARKADSSEGSSEQSQ